MSDAVPGTVPSLEQVADRLAITEILHTHSRGVDRADTDILKSCYWEDAEVDYGAFKGKAWTFCESLPGAIKRYRATQHRVSNIIVQQDGSDAVTESYVTAYHFLEVPEGESTEMTYIGRYLDRFQKRDNVWRMTFRHIVMDWHQLVPTTHDDNNPGLKGITVGARLPDDISSQFLYQ